MEEVSLLFARGSGAEDDDAALVEHTRVDPRAFGVLYRRYLAPVYRYLRARTGDEADAADLTQQVFLKALDALPRYHDRGLPFAAWLFRIARNAAIDAHRRQRPALSLELLPETLERAAEDNPESAVLRQEELVRLRALLVRLDVDKRELLALRFAAGLGPREIAAVVGKREAAVKKQLTRVLRALKEQYDEA